MSSVGAGGRSASVNQGRLFIHLKPRDERAMSADEVAQSLTRKLAAVPGMRVYIQNPPVINIGGRQSKSQYQFTLQSSDIEALYDGAAALERRLHDIPGLTDVTSDLQIRNPQVKVEHRPRPRGRARHRRRPDRERALQRLRRAPGQHHLHARTTSTGWSWSCCPQYQRDLSALNLLHITGREGVSVPLGQPGAGDAVDRAAHGEPLGPAARR